MAPEGLSYDFVAGGVGMEAVGEVEGGFGGDVFEEKGDEEGVVGPGEFGIDGGEGFGEFAAHVGGRFHARDYDFYFRVFPAGSVDD